jgi:1-acyl-sn-glycerol-3-phosphate acyltransferase
MGWRFEGEVPDLPRCVLIVAPHTSNWDFPVGLAAKLALGLRGSWLGKHTIFRGPVGPVFRWMDGIPVDRNAPGGIIEGVVERFRSSPRMLLALAPEGTRRRVPDWKRGFYRIAEAAGAAILPVAFDWSTRCIRFFPPLVPSGDYPADLARLKAHFRREMARRPENY